MMTRRNVERICISLIRLALQMQQDGEKTEGREDSGKQQNKPAHGSSGPTTKSSRSQLHLLGPTVTNEEAVKPEET